MTAPAKRLIPSPEGGQQAASRTDTLAQGHDDRRAPIQQSTAGLRHSLIRASILYIPPPWTETPRSSHTPSALQDATVVQNLEPWARQTSHVISSRGKKSENATRTVNLSFYTLPLSAIFLSLLSPTLLSFHFLLNSTHAPLPLSKLNLFLLFNANEEDYNTMIYLNKLKFSILLFESPNAIPHDSELSSHHCPTSHASEMASPKSNS